MRRLVAIVTGLTILVAGAAGAKPAAPIDLRDARYCEVLELRGQVPDAQVRVWNTIGLNECPPTKWEALDAAALAEQIGAELVILNGPRHFLMDSASARIGRRVRTFGGLRMRKVATITIDEASDLVRAPYTERTIERVNTWEWEAGRRVFELRAPGGVSYVMQSYSQIVDPGQRIGDLPELGERLTLPEGWRFRTRRLRKDLVLGARGEATVIQDDLQNTYQRVAGRRP